jgi:hypothetical protein
MAVPVSMVSTDTLAPVCLDFLDFNVKLTSMNVLPIHVSMEDPVLMEPILTPVHAYPVILDCNVRQISTSVPVLLVSMEPLVWMR